MHYFAIVIVPAGADVERAVSTQMARYDENLEVPEHDEQCWDCEGADTYANDQCGECSGKGIVRTTYNPEGHWDFYQIGGRWTGRFDGYDPTTDPRNSERCWLCEGTGGRTEFPRAGAGNLPCNGCDATGVAQKWPTQWASYPGDIVPVSKWPDDVIPHTIVDPKGNWYQREWWNAKERDFVEHPNWTGTVEEIRRDFGDHLAVIVDYHS